MPEIIQNHKAATNINDGTLTNPGLLMLTGRKMEKIIVVPQQMTHMALGVTQQIHIQNGNIAHVPRLLLREKLEENTFTFNISVLSNLI